MPRFFIDKSDIDGNFIILKDENMHHLINVLRESVGASVTVCDKCGLDYSCVINKICKDSVILDILEKYPTVSESSYKITLFQALPKGDKLSYIVEKGVEAGVYKIVPVLMTRSVSRLSKKDFHKKRERLLKVSLSAAKQCGRGIVPDVSELVDFSELKDLFSSFDKVIFPYEKENNLSLKSFLRNNDFKNIGVIIGPEGGFSDEEVTELLKIGCEKVTLGKRILRTETAGIATIFNILYEKD